MIGIPSSDKKPRLKKDGTPRKQPKPPKKGADRKPHEWHCGHCNCRKPQGGGKWVSEDVWWCKECFGGMAQELDNMRRKMIAG